MNKPHYQYQTSADGQYYFFESIGKNTIPKVVGYILRDEASQLVELVFGDLIDDQRIDVMAVSDNQDLALVITTVIGTLADYLERFPEKTVYFQGSTPSRTRLYRAAIAKSLSQIEHLYEVFGILPNDQLEIFNKGHHYQAYIIRKKYEI